jgi:hypothetical protein
MDFNYASDCGFKWEWFPLQFWLSRNLFTGWISFLPRLNVVWHWGFGWQEGLPHVWIERRTIRECVRMVHADFTLK